MGWRGAFCPGLISRISKGLVMKRIILSIAVMAAMLFGSLAVPSTAEARPWRGGWYGPRAYYGYGYRPYYGGYYGYRPYYGGYYPRYYSAYPGYYGGYGGYGYGYPGYGYGY